MTTRTSRTLHPEVTVLRDLRTTYRFELWGSTVAVAVSDPSALRAAVEIVRAGLDEVDRACSWYRPDSELAGLVPGRQQLSPLLADLVGTALDAAEASAGLVDPTSGSAMPEWGEGRGVGVLPADRAHLLSVGAEPGWRRVHLYGDQLELPAGVHLDLRATAKARAADLLARRAADTIGVGVLVELGGDVATAAPANADVGWQVRVEDPAIHVTLRSGWSLATSSTVRRTWRSATVAAPTCVEATLAATAASTLGREAARWLSERCLSARLVDRSHRVTRVGDWPREARAA